nr:MAG TPA: hypothetical protein [Caudoviricetes sp.]
MASQTKCWNTRTLEHLKIKSLNMSCLAKWLLLEH